MTTKKARVEKNACIACGLCLRLCPREAIIMLDPDFYAQIDATLCVGCGLCAKNCPARAIDIIDVNEA